MIKQYDVNQEIEKGRIKYLKDIPDNLDIPEGWNSCDRCGLLLPVDELLWDGHLSQEDYLIAEYMYKNGWTACLSANSSSVSVVL